MSTALAVLPLTDPPLRRDRLTGPHLLAAEWIKFRTLRSSWYTLLASAASLVILGSIIGYNTGRNYGHQQLEDIAPSGVMQGYYLTQLLIAVLGVLFVSAEYSTGMIRSTLAAVPTRVPVLIAKAGVFGVVTLVTMVGASFLTFAAAQLFLRRDHHGTALTDPTVLRVVIGTGVYLTLVGLFGSALGWILRSTPGGIASVVAVFLVLPNISRFIPATREISQYLPSAAGGSFVHSTTIAGQLTAWPGLAVMTAWVAAALIAAAVVLRTRDV